MEQEVEQLLSIKEKYQSFFGFCYMLKQEDWKPVQKLVDEYKKLKEENNKQEKINLKIINDLELLNVKFKEISAKYLQIKEFFILKENIIAIEHQETDIIIHLRNPILDRKSLYFEYENKKLAKQEYYNLTSKML